MIEKDWTWDELLRRVQQGVENGPEIADGVYKRVIEILDSKIERDRQRFTAEGTTDLDGINFILCAHYMCENLDPGLVAGLATAAIYRLARQK